MADYINREKLYQYLDNEVEWNNNQDRLSAMEVVFEFPVGDVAPVLHGEWIADEYFYYRCSNCGFEQDAPEYVSLYCPQCGAKMDMMKEE